MPYPKRASGLPPGQRLVPHMSRFTDRPLDPPPDSHGEVHLHITRNGKPVGEVRMADLDALEPRDVVADFHCVTTWSVTDMVWTGVALREVLDCLGLLDTATTYVRATAADTRRGTFVWDDAVAPSVMLATHLNGAPLGARNGGPLRLVAPEHYGYKSIKHLTSLDLRDRPPSYLGKEHLRGRVAHEERHPKLPAWLVRRPYRLLVVPTSALAERSLAGSIRQ